MIARERLSEDTAAVGELDAPADRGMVRDRRSSARAGRGWEFGSMPEHSSLETTSRFTHQETET